MVIWKPPALMIAMGSLLGGSLLALLLSWMLPEPARAFLFPRGGLIAGGLAMAAWDILYRRRKARRLDDISLSTFFFIFPTWTAGIIVAVAAFLGLVTGGDTSTARVQSPPTVTPVPTRAITASLILEKKLELPEQLVSRQDFSGDGSLLAVSTIWGSVVVYDTNSWEVARSYEASVPASYVGVAFAAEKHLLAMNTGYESFGVWDADSGEWIFQKAAQGLENVAFAPGDGEIVTGGSIAPYAGVWDARSGAAVREMNYLTGHRFSADGRWLAARVPSSKTLAVYEAGGYQFVREIATGDDHFSYDFSPDGERLFVFTPHRIQVYTTGTWALEKEVESNSQIILGACSPDGRLLATAVTSLDNLSYLQLWAVGAEITYLQTYPLTGGSSALTFGRGAAYSDGNRLLAVASGSFVNIYEIEYR